MKQTEAYQRLVEKGLRPSLQRIAIMDWLIKHQAHPNVIEDVYKRISREYPNIRADNRLQQYTPRMFE